MFKVIIACMLASAYCNNTEKIIYKGTPSHSILPTATRSPIASATRTPIATASRTPIATRTATSTPNYSRTVSSIPSPSNSPTPSTSEKNLRKSINNTEANVGEWVAYTFLGLALIAAILIISALSVYYFKKPPAAATASKNKIYDIESNSITYISDSSESSQVRYRLARSPSHNADMYTLPR